MGKKRPRSVTGQEIVNACLCAGYHDGSLLQDGHGVCAGPNGPPHFDSAKHYYAYMQAAVLAEVRVQVGEALLSAQRPRPGHGGKDGKGEKGGKGGGFRGGGGGGKGGLGDGGLHGFGTPVALQLHTIQRDGGRPLASLYFTEVRDRNGGGGGGRSGGGRAGAEDLLKDLRPGGIFLLRPRGGSEILAVVDGRSSSLLEPAFEVLGAALSACGDGFGGGRDGSELSEFAERRWEGWHVASVLVSQRCADVCQRRPAPPSILHRLLGGAQSKHTRFAESDSDSGGEAEGQGAGESQGETL